MCLDFQSKLAKQATHPRCQTTRRFKNPRYTVCQSVFSHANSLSVGWLVHNFRLRCISCNTKYWMDCNEIFYRQSGFTKSSSSLWSSGAATFNDGLKCLCWNENMLPRMDCGNFHHSFVPLTKYLQTSWHHHQPQVYWRWWTSTALHMLKGLHLYNLQQFTCINYFLVGF